MLLMLDETIVTETPPVHPVHGPIGEQVRVPISGTHNKRVLHGAINIRKERRSRVVDHQGLDPKTRMKRSSD